MKAVLIAAIVGLLVVSACLAGCTGAQTSAGTASATPLKLGIVASLTGPASTTGKDVWQSAQMAADEINGKGGVFVKSLGRNANIQLVQGDDESTREGGMKAVTKMITDDKVDALVGGFSSAVVTAHESIVAEHGVPYIISGASSSTVTHRTDINTSMMFHHAPITDASASQTTIFVDEIMRPAINAKFNRPADQPLKMAVIYQDSPFGKGALDSIKKTIADKNLKVQVIAEEPYKMGETDYRTILTSVKAKGPDVVYPIAFLNEEVPMLTQARRDVGLNTIFLAVECVDDPDYYKGLGQYGDYSIIESRFSAYAVPKGSISANVEKYQKDYTARFNTSPGMMGAATYEGVYIAAAALEKAGTMDRAALIGALGSVQVPEMVESMENGTISFDNQFHESQFNLFMEQLHWDPATQLLRPKIVWPAELKEMDFQIPDWYRPGGG
jgi:branched-chain amino acid transport system substrate-binding protein